MICRWLLFLLLCSLPSVASAAELTQRDWMVQLIDSLGRSFGLPDEPEDEDYIRLLSGDRSLRLEAEASRQPTDRVAIKHFTNYGNYSGDGWVSGLREPTELNIRFLLRNAGAYRLAVASRLPGIKLRLAGREFTAEGNDQFARYELGEIDLPAGATEIVVDLPPQAGIDYVELLASPGPAIAPLGGWQPDQPLTAEDLALTVLQVLDLQAFLPAGTSGKPLEAETLATANGVQQVRNLHLGAPSAGAWLRAGNQPVKLQIPLPVDRSACYRFQVRGSSLQPVEFSIPQILSQQISFGEALTTKLVGSFCVEKRTLDLQVNLPAWAGLDFFELVELDSSRSRLLKLAGLNGGTVLIDAALVNELLKLISSLTY